MAKKPFLGEPSSPPVYVEAPDGVMIAGGRFGDTGRSSMYDSTYVGNGMGYGAFFDDKWLGPPIDIEGDGVPQPSTPIRDKRR